MLDQGYWLMPNSVLYSTELSDKQKLLFCAISSLCAEKGYCRAKNEYLWEMFWVHKITISKNISVLQELGFIEITDDWEWRRISISENAKGVSENAKGGLAKTLSPYIYTNNTNEYLYSNYYWKKKWINEKACDKLISNKIKQWVTLEDINKWMVLYNCECRLKQDWQYVKKFETWITEYQLLTEDDIEEQLKVIATIYKKNLNTNPKFAETKIAKDTREELTNTFWDERIRTIWRTVWKKTITLNLN